MISFPILSVRLLPPLPSLSWVRYGCDFKFYRLSLAGKGCMCTHRQDCPWTNHQSSQRYHSVPSRLSQREHSISSRHTWQGSTAAEHTSTVDRVQEVRRSRFSQSQEERVGATTTKSPPDPLSLRLPSISFAVSSHVFLISLSTVTTRNGRMKSDCISRVRYEAWRLRFEEQVLGNEASAKPHHDFRSSCGSIISFNVQQRR